MRRLREFLTRYITRRTSEGAFRSQDPVLAARAFVGMVVDHLIIRQVLGQREDHPQPSEKVAETYTSIFLDGMCTPATASKRPTSQARSKRSSHD